MFHQPGFDLAQLDAEAADLDLKIVAPHKLDVAVRQPPPQVSRAVHPRSRLQTEWIGKKLLRSQLRTVQIPTRHPPPTDVHLPGLSHRDRLAVCVQNVYLSVRNRSAYRRIASVFCVTAMHRRA